MMKTKTIMFCSLMYRIAEEVEKLFLWMQLNKIPATMSAVWGKHLEIISYLCQYLPARIVGKEKDQITANISGRTVTPSVCMR